MLIYTLLKKSEILFFSKILHEEGTGIIQVIAMLAILTGLSTYSLQRSSLNKQKNETTKTFLTIRQIEERINSTLLNNVSCTNQISALGDLRSVSSINEIKAINEDVIVRVNEKDSNNRIRVLSISLKGKKSGTNYDTIQNSLVTDGTGTYSGIINLIVRYSKISKQLSGTKDGLLVFPLQVKTDNSFITNECYSLFDNVVNNGRQEACEFVGGLFDVEMKTCSFQNISATETQTKTNSSNTQAASLLFLENYIDQLNFPSKYVQVSGAIMKGDLNVGSKAIVQRLCVNENCTNNLNENLCGNGQVVVGRNSDGVLICKTLFCPAGTFFTGVGSAGANCQSFPNETCPVGQYVAEVSSTGSVVCKDIPLKSNLICPSGKILRGIDSSGSAICEIDSNSINVTCPAGSCLISINGNSAVCSSGCSPSCPSASTICSGSSYSGSDGCGGVCSVSGAKNCSSVCVEGSTQQIEGVGTMCSCTPTKPFMCNPRINQICSNGSWVETSCITGGCAEQSCI